MALVITIIGNLFLNKKEEKNKQIKWLNVVSIFVQFLLIMI